MRTRRRRPLVETSLSRLLRWSDQHDMAIVTGWRHALDCGKGRPLTRAEKDARNREIVREALRHGYGVVSVGGWSLESNRPVAERAVLLVDIDDRGDLRDFAMRMGRRYEQDSIVFSPAGDRGAWLIGTNDCPNNFLRNGQTLRLDHFALGKFNIYGTTMPRGRRTMVWYDDETPLAETPDDVVLVPLDQPGLEAGTLVRWLRENGLRPQRVTLTRDHGPVPAGPAIALIVHPGRNIGRFFGLRAEPFGVRHWLLVPANRTRGRWMEGDRTVAVLSGEEAQTVLDDAGLGLGGGGTP